MARAARLVGTFHRLRRALSARPAPPTGVLLVAAGGIVFADARFNYGKPDGPAALAGVDLVVRPGERIGIVGPAGAVFPIGDDAALAAAWATVLALPPAERAALRATVRRRIVERFDVRDMVRRYHALYAELLAAAGKARPAPA